MKVAALLENRRQTWMELDRLCATVRGGKLTPEMAVRFSSLYRAACADLALADAYQLQLEIEEQALKTAAVEACMKRPTVALS